MNTLTLRGLRPLDRTPVLAALIPAALLGLIAVAPLAAQQPPQGDTVSAGAAYAAAQGLTRGQLQTRLDSLRALPADSARLARVARVERRLTQGDFQPGDIVQVSVWGDSAMSGTFTVTPTRTLEISNVAPIDLRGILYSEADSVVGAGLSSLLRNPRVTVRTLTRIAVLGAVGKPGYYDLPPTSSVADALMAAGGPQQKADLDNLQLERAGQNILPSDDQNAKVSNLTLADLGVEPGDQLIVPTQGGGLGIKAILGGVGAAAGLTWMVVRLFRGR